MNEILLYWRKTKIAGFNIEEQLIASLMLGGLPEEYRAMILDIENSGNDLTVDYVRTVLLQGIPDFIMNEIKEVAFAAGCNRSFGRTDRRRKCFTCGSIYHLKFECPEVKKGLCFKCGSNKHLANSTGGS